MYIENIENDHEAKVSSTDKELAKLKLENKLLNEKLTRQTKELSSLRSGSKEKLMARIPMDEVRHSVPTNIASTLNSTQNTMVLFVLPKRNYLENFRRGKVTMLSANRVEPSRLSAPKLPEQMHNESTDSPAAGVNAGNSLTIRRLKHSAHHSISNPQGLAEELKNKQKNSFTSSFQRLLSTYKKSKDTHKSVSIGATSNGNHSEGLLPKARTNIFTKNKTVLRTETSNSALGHSTGDRQDKERRLLKSQKVFNTKKTHED